MMIMSSDYSITIIVDAEAFKLSWEDQLIFNQTAISSADLVGWALHAHPLKCVVIPPRPRKGGDRDERRQAKQNCHRPL